MLNNKDKFLKKDQKSLESEYSIKLSKVTKDERFEIREMINLYDMEKITRVELTEELGDIRNKYNPVKDDINNKLEKKLAKIDVKYDNWIPKISNKLLSSHNEIDEKIAIVWNEDTNGYEVVSSSSVVSPHRPIITGLVTFPTQIQLFWDSPPSIDNVLVTGYKIEIKRDNQNYYTLVKDTGNRNTSYTHTDLISGEFYSYRISAITDVKISEPSNEIRASSAVSYNDRQH